MKGNRMTQHGGYSTRFLIGMLKRICGIVFLKTLRLLASLLASPRLPLGIRCMDKKTFCVTTDSGIGCRRLRIY
jgi:hypothetical protein